MARLSDRADVTPTSSGGALAKKALLVILACLAAFLVAGCSGGANETSQEETEASTDTTREEETVGGPGDKPNIIFVLVDDLDLASVQKMPQINSLLRDEGMSFEETFISHPLCCPSRSTILTGLYDHNHHVRGNRPPDGGFQKFLSEGHEEDAIGVRLQEGGYRTAFFGKYLNGYTAEDPTHVPPGWDEWYGKLQEQKLYDHSSTRMVRRSLTVESPRTSSLTCSLARRRTSCGRRRWRTNLSSPM